MSEQLDAIEKVVDLSTNIFDRLILLTTDPTTLIELGILVVCALTGIVGAKTINRRQEGYSNPILKSIATHPRFIYLLPIFLAAMLIWIAYRISPVIWQTTTLLRPAAILLSTWVLIQAVTSALKPGVASQLIRILTWLLTVLWLFKQLGNFLELLGNIKYESKTLSLSLLDAIISAVVILGVIWLAGILSRYLNGHVSRAKSLTPSVKVLSSKMIHIGLYAAAILIGASVLGIDLTALAVFGGALGVGIGLGLQKIVANFISGIILLLDKSIKPGDVITVGDTYGWVEKLNTRFVSVTTRAGVEYLIPNENVITQEVINWTHSNANVRLEIPIGVSYSSDMRLVEKLCVEAAKTVPRVLSSPGPVCLFVGLGDSSVDFKVRFWISDPENGASNVRSGVFFAVWEAFNVNNIEIPFPQRVLHLKDKNANLND